MGDIRMRWFPWNNLSCCELLAHAEAEKMAAQIDWRVVAKNPPPQSWFDDDDNPFVLEEPAR